MMALSIDHLTHMTFFELESQFRLGTLPVWDDVSGLMHGTVLAPYPYAPWYRTMGHRRKFRHWTGKRFLVPWGKTRTDEGWGVNVFPGLQALPFRTYPIDDSTLVLDYTHVPSPTLLLRDLIRVVGPRLCLGQIVWLCPERITLGYFALEKEAADAPVHPGRH